MRMAAYCRVSTEKEEQLSSLKNQREFFMQYARKCGDTLVEIYADEGVSGKCMRKRDAFMRLLKDSENGCFDYVAVKDISRFARNTSDFLYGIRTLKNNGVDVRFLSGNQTVIGESEFVLTVFAALAQEESVNLSKRVIFGKKQNAKKGRVPNMIYGYDRVDAYNLSINARESETVRLMFKWYLEGLGTRRICTRLNEMGIPTKLGAKWTSRTVRRILSNPVYSGVLVNNKSVTKDFLAGTRETLPQQEWYTHDRPEWRLVSREDFETVQRSLAERSNQYKAHSGRYSGKHLFSNLITCGVCGGAFTARVYRGKTVRVYYRCAAHNSGGNGRCTNAATVEETELVCEIEKLLKERGRTLEKRDASKQLQNNMCLSVAHKQLARRRERLKEMYVNGLIGMEELKEEFINIENGLKSIEKETADSAANTADTPRGYINSDMREIIDKIVVYPDKSYEINFKKETA